MSALAGVLVLMLAVPTGPATAAAGEPGSLCRNGFYVIDDHSLRKFDEFGEVSEAVTQLSSTVNAVGYVAGEDVLIGLAASRVVTIDRQGTIRERGAAPKGLSGARAGTVSGRRWLVRAGGELVAVDTSSLAVVSRVPLSAYVDVDDWDVNPDDGKLYGLATGLLQTSLVRIDPGTGEVTRVYSFGLLPLLDSYGAVAIDMRGTMHALHSGSGRMYHMPLNNPGRFTTTNPGLHSGTSDAAGCPVEWDYSTAPEGYGNARHTTTNVGTLTLGTAEISLSGALDVNVAVVNTTGRPALLAAWYDQDADGRFGAAELVTATVSATSTVPLRWPAAAGESSWLRLRLYGRRAGSVSPIGPANSGGVEDYPIRIVRAQPVRPPQSQPPPTSSSPGTGAGQPTPAPSPSASVSQEPKKVPGAVGVRPKPSPRLPVTLFLFTGMLIPAIIVAARAAGRKRRAHP